MTPVPIEPARREDLDAMLRLAATSGLPLDGLARVRGQHRPGVGADEDREATADDAVDMTPLEHAESFPDARMCRTRFPSSLASHDSSVAIRVTIGAHRSGVTC